MLGVPSLPSLAMRRWRGERDESGFCGMRAFRDEGWDCDWADDDDEWAVVDMLGASSLPPELGAGKYAGAFSGVIRTVALGSVILGCEIILASENGRKGAESSCSSSASDNGPRGGLELE